MYVKKYIEHCLIKVIAYESYLLNLIIISAIIESISHYAVILF